MDGDEDIVLREPEGAGDGRVEYLGHRLDLEIVIAGAQRPHLAALAFLGMVGNEIGPGAGHPPRFLDPLEVVRRAPPAFDRPLGAAGEHGVHLARIERNRSLAAEAGRDLMKQRLGKRLLHENDVGGR